MANNDAFNNYTIDLGDNRIGVDKTGIDDMFTAGHTSTAPTCLICGNTASVKLIPKHKRLATAEIEDRGYACTHCIQQQYISPDDYKLRKLGE